MIRLLDGALKRPVATVFWSMLLIIAGLLLTGCDLSSVTATPAPTATVAATAQPTATLDPSATPDPSPTRIAPPEYFKCAKPVRLPTADVCFPVGFADDAPEMETDGAESGVVFEPGEFIAVNLSASTPDRCVLQGSDRWVKCSLLVDFSGGVD